MLCDYHEPHFAVLVYDHAAYLGECSVAAAGGFVRFEDESWAVAELGCVSEGWYGKGKGKGKVPFAELRLGISLSRVEILMFEGLRE